MVDCARLESEYPPLADPGFESLSLRQIILTVSIMELQKKCATIVTQIDDKYDTKRDVHFCFTQLIEELGELARELNMPRLRKKKIKKENVEDEFADVLILLCSLAEMLNVDLEESVTKKIEILKKKHEIN